MSEESSSKVPCAILAAIVVIGFVGLAAIPLLKPGLVVPSLPSSPAPPGPRPMPVMPAPVAPLGSAARFYWGPGTLLRSPTVLGLDFGLEQGLRGRPVPTGKLTITLRPSDWNDPTVIARIETTVAAADVTPTFKRDFELTPSRPIGLDEQLHLELELVTDDGRTLTTRTIVWIQKGR